HTRDGRVGAETPGPARQDVSLQGHVAVDERPRAVARTWHASKREKLIPTQRQVACKRKLGGQLSSPGRIAAESKRADGQRRGHPQPQGRNDGLTQDCTAELTRFARALEVIGIVTELARNARMDFEIANPDPRSPVSTIGKPRLALCQRSLGP